MLIKRLINEIKVKVQFGQIQHINRNFTTSDLTGSDMVICADDRITADDLWKAKDRETIIINIIATLTKVLGGRTSIIM